MCGENPDRPQESGSLFKGFYMKKNIDALAAEYVLRLIFKGERNAEQFRKKTQATKVRE